MTVTDVDYDQDVRSMAAEFLATVPDVDWCGGCGGVTRPFTDDEVTALFQHAQDYLAWAPPSMVIQGFARVCEIQARAVARRCTCRCHPEANPHSGCFLYRLWGEDDRLLYVGVSRNLRARLRTHRKNWGDLIKRVSYEQHPDEASMLAAERQAIRDEFPAFNRAGC